ncbi:uncharacterized protein PAN0_005c2677 [Moesziomyces antarcticus]|uniref:Uncharacterized protein n=2 Tax=Pseudozyma antarctica TaxID=84753 RepID=A0A081CCR7_PSEA2|nr:uncharacterized protein PAN0_005c2677 [Moesziomyces antarcticus]GAK64463.1 hypothetical protein PAN0_005c2677 [Moesziomyces antarcticus]SPO45028.1 uncharacterized protein PSANT_02714 [Moesziomyces antarcticus]
MPMSNPLIEFFTEHYNFDVAMGAIEDHYEHLVDDLNEAGPHSSIEFRTAIYENFFQRIYEALSILGRFADAFPEDTSVEDQLRFYQNLCEHIHEYFELEGTFKDLVPAWLD